MALFDVIRYDCGGNQDWVLYKYPENNITTGSLLVVQEGQSAVFVQDGGVADIFGPGKHELNTDNLPILNRIVNLPFGGKSPFPAEIYFVNTTARLAFSWGTPGPIQVTEGTGGERFQVRAFGEIGICVADEMTVFAQAIGGLEKAGLFGVEQLKSFFRSLITTNVQKGVADCFREGGRAALQNSDGLQNLSDYIIGGIAPEMEQYGFFIVDFKIQNVNVQKDLTFSGSRRCGKCRRVMQDDFLFCPYCGIRIPERNQDKAFV